MPQKKNFEINLYTNINYNTYKLGTLRCHDVRLGRFIFDAYAVQRSRYTDIMAHVTNDNLYLGQHY